MSDAVILLAPATTSLPPNVVPVTRAAAGDFSAALRGSLDAQPRLEPGSERDAERTLLAAMLGAPALTALPPAAVMIPVQLQSDASLPVSHTAGGSSLLSLADPPAGAGPAVGLPSLSAEGVAFGKAVQPAGTDAVRAAERSSKERRPAEGSLQPVQPGPDLRWPVTAGGNPARFTPVPESVAHPLPASSEFRATTAHQPAGSPPGVIAESNRLAPVLHAARMDSAQNPAGEVSALVRAHQRTDSSGAIWVAPQPGEAGVEATRIAAELTDAGPAAIPIVPPSAEEGAGPAPASANQPVRLGDAAPVAAAAQPVPINPDRALNPALPAFGSESAAVIEPAVYSGAHRTRPVRAAAPAGTRTTRADTGIGPGMAAVPPYRSSTPAGESATERPAARLDTGRIGSRRAAAAYASASAVNETRVLDPQTANLRSPSEAGPTAGTEAPGRPALVWSAAQAALTGTTMAGTRTVDQVASALSLQIKDGRTEATIALRPAALGAIKVQISSGTGGMVIRLSAERDAVGELLRSQMSDLRDALAGHQITVAELHVLHNPPAVTPVQAPAPQVPVPPWLHRREESTPDQRQPQRDQPEDEQEP